MAVDVIDNHQGLRWLMKHSPIFEKMVLETNQRLKSEAEYRKLKPCQNGPQSK